MAPISSCQSGRRVITGDRTAHLSCFLSCACADAFLSFWVAAVADADISPSSKIGLHSISSLPTLCPHHCVTPCHSPGSALSDDELLVPRLPAGILGYCSTVTPCFWENQADKALSRLFVASKCVSVHLCVSVCVFVIMLLYETWMKVGSITGEFWNHMWNILTTPVSSYYCTWPCLIRSGAPCYSKENMTAPLVSDCRDLTVLNSEP